MPRLTVAIITYNDADYIAEAVDSILGQSFTDFELLVINDGSTDNTHQILENYTDQRLRIINFNENKGRPFARNHALEQAQSPYLAWLDADDIATPTRLETQVNFMASHTDVALCGGYIQCFGASNQLIRVKTNHEAIAAGAIWYNSLYNTSACLRLEHIHKFNIRYRDNLLRAQDYAFLAEIALTTNLQLANISQVLTHYRYFHRPSTPAYHVKATKYVLRALGLSHDESSCLKHSILSLNKPDLAKHIQTNEILHWANKIYTAVLNRQDIDTQQFLRVTQAKVESFLDSLTMRDDEYIKALQIYAASPLGKTHSLQKYFKK